MFFDDATTVVIDNGSGSVKAGFASDGSPTAIIPSIVGRPHYKVAMWGVEDRGQFIGEEAQRKRGVLDLKYPIEHGVITDWDDMEKIWHHTFYNELRVAPEEHPVLLTEAPLNPKANREKMAQLMFEAFDVPALYVTIDGTLTIYATGKITGIALSCGDGVSHAIPVCEGTVLTSAISRLDMAGRDVTEYLSKMLRERGHFLSSSAELDIVREIKERLCYVAEDYDEEMRKATVTRSLETSYELPDGRPVIVSSERFRAAEALFQPTNLGIQHGGIHELLHESITACEDAIRHKLYARVVLSGGSTTFPGFAHRLYREITALAPLMADISIMEQDDRMNSVWLGGAVKASLPSFQKMWVTRQEYEEYGAVRLEERFL